MSSPDRRSHAGRAVVTRAAALDGAGVPASTAERWYRDRAHNGHPTPVLAVGRRLYFDEAALRAWVRAQLHPEPAPDRIVRGGRALVTGAEIARLTGLPERVVARLRARRATNRYPAPVHRDRHVPYFDEAAALAWHAAARAAG
jgi:hypothetical protein